jgi:tetratricopeptide (TPR) repeat protein
MSCAKPATPHSAAELLDLGEKYLLELNYEQALVQFHNLIEVEPMNSRGYTGAAEAYVGLGQIDDAIAILEIGLEIVETENEIQRMIDELRRSEPDIDEYELYYQFMNSRQWAEDYRLGDYVGTTDIEITAYKIFDFDDNGTNELWLEAYAYDYRPRGISGFYTIEGGQVKNLLIGNLSGGSIGGDWVAVRFDAQTGNHLIGLEGFAGGFGGNSSWGEYFEYVNGQISGVFNIFTMSQVEYNFSETQLEDETLYYVEEHNLFSESEPQSRYITIYEIDNVQVTREAYEQIRTRLLNPSEEKFILKDGLFH